MEDEKHAQDDEQQVVMFKLHNEDFSIDISKIAEILKVPQYTKIPCSADYVEGIINFRGVITAVIDLNIKLGFPKKEDDKDTRIIVIELGEHQAVGLRVDEVSEVMKIKKRDIKPAPAIISEKISSSYIRGVIVMNEKSLLIVLDSDKILSATEVNNLTQAAATFSEKKESKEEATDEGQAKDSEEEAKLTKTDESDDNNKEETESSK